MCLAAVRKNGWVLPKVKNRTPEICKAAFEQGPTSLATVHREGAGIWSIYVESEKLTYMLRSSRLDSYFSEATRSGYSKARLALGRDSKVYYDAMGSDGYTVCRTPFEEETKSTSAMSAF